MSNSIGAMRVKNVCIEFRNYCEAQNLEEWVYLNLHEVLFSPPFNVIVSELIKFIFNIYQKKKNYGTQIG